VPFYRLISSAINRNFLRLPRVEILFLTNKIYSEPRRIFADYRFSALCEVVRNNDLCANFTGRRGAAPTEIQRLAINYGLIFCVQICTIITRAFEYAKRIGVFYVCFIFEEHPQISLSLERKMPLKPARLFASFSFFFFQKEKEHSIQQKIVSRSSRFFIYLN
jgi:hypothetical protein